MWNRKDIKKKGKSAFKRNYWKCVFVAILLVFCTSTSDFRIDYNNDYSTELISDTSYSGVSINLGNIEILRNSNDDNILKIGYFTLNNVTFLFIFIVIMISIILSVFVFNVIEVGGCSFFVRNIEENNASIKTLLDYFDNENYMNIVKVQFVKDIKIFLWTLLFIIPGIIKTYEYYMVPYILEKNPELDYQEVLSLSKEMMNGNKFDTFVLELSFIGWNILSALTLGILGYLFVRPYFNSTCAQLYLELSKNNVEFIETI
jgi:uncharacterized membrane protein